MHGVPSMSASPTKMVKVCAAEFRRNVRTYEDIAHTRPVAVTRNRRAFVVMISMEEFRRLKRRDRRVLHLEDFTDADIAALQATRAPESSRALDHELT
jgi:Antitoxin Phd_YefM, type II toxin-antitoxin system